MADIDSGSTSSLVRTSVDESASFSDNLNLQTEDSHCNSDFEVHRQEIVKSADVGKTTGNQGLDASSCKTAAIVSNSELDTEFQKVGTNPKMSESSEYQTVGPNPKPVQSSEYQTVGPNPKPVQSSEYQTVGPNPKQVQSSEYQTVGPNPKPVQSSEYQTVGPNPKPVQSSEYQRVGPNPKAVSEYQVVGPNPKPVEKKDDKETDCSEKKPEGQCDIEETSNVNRDLENEEVTSSKDAEKHLKRASSVKEKRVSGDSKGVHRSASFTKKALQKMTGKKQKRDSDELEDYEKLVMLDKANGTLYLKKKKLFSVWRRYFFVLDGSLLLYYTNYEHFKKFTGCQGSVDLTLLESVVKKKPSTCFRRYYPLLLGRRSLTPLYLGAESETEQERWFELLQRALDTRKAASERVRKASKATSQMSSPDVVSSTLRNSGSDCDSPKSSDKISKKSTKKKFSFRSQTSKSEDTSEKEKTGNDKTCEYQIDAKASKNSKEGNNEIDDEVEIIKPKKLSKTGMALPGMSTQALAIKLRKTSEATEKVVEIKLEEPPPNFGVQLKKVKNKTELDQAHPTSDSKKTEQDPEHDFRSLLRSSKHKMKDSSSIPPTILGEEFVDEKTQEEEKRSPSLSVPPSKTLETVIEKSTDDDNLVFGNSKPEMKEQPEETPSPIITRQVIILGDQKNQTLCPVNHAVAEDIRYSDPPNEIEILTVVKPVDKVTVTSENNDHTIEIDQQELSQETLDNESKDENVQNQESTTTINNNLESAPSNDDVNIMGSRETYSELEFNVSQDKEASSSKEASGSVSDSTSVASSFTTNHEQKMSIKNDISYQDIVQKEPVILDNESSISLSPVLSREMREFDKMTKSFEDLDSLYLQEMDNTTTSTTEPKFIIDEPYSEDHSSYKAEDREESFDKLEADKYEKPDSDAEIDFVVINSASDFQSDQVTSLHDSDVSDISNKLDESVHSSIQENLYPKTDSQANDELGEEGSRSDVKFQPQISIARSSSIESGEPLTRTSFMGGRRSWGSASNFDPKIDPNSGSNTSGESMDASLRSSTYSDPFSPCQLSTATFSNNMKRNSSGYAETLATEQAFVKRAKMRPISNPAIGNRESLILPEFVVMEEGDNTEDNVTKQADDVKKDSEIANYTPETEM